MRKYGVAAIVFGLLAVLALSAGLRLWIAPPGMPSRTEATNPANAVPAAASPAAPIEQPVKPAAVRPGIQWFTSWQSGQREAERLNVPILLVSGAPHCAGVSGIW